MSEDKTQEASAPVEAKEEVPVEHLEGGAKERKSSGSLNSLLDSDNDDCDATFEKSM